MIEVVYVKLGVMAKLLVVMVRYRERKCSMLIAVLTKIEKPLCVCLCVKETLREIDNVCV